MQCFAVFVYPATGGDPISKFANPDRYTGSIGFALLTAKSCSTFSTCAFDELDSVAKMESPNSAVTRTGGSP